MLSNLAFHPYRIRTDQVVRERLSFTACIIAIALYNGDLSILFCHDGLCISNQMFEIDRSRDTRNMLGIWSPRLSRIGMHVQDSETKSWRRVPLGKGMYYENSEAFLKM